MASGGTLSDLLETLGYEPDDVVWLGSLDHTPGVEYPFSNLPVRVDAADTVIDGLTKTGRSTYFMVNRSSRTKGKGRGQVQDITQAMALYVDIDVKPGGVDSWEMAGEVIDRIAQALGCDPVAIVHSGHGLQPYWTLDDEQVTDENRAEVMRLYERFGAFARIQAQLVGGKLDSVFDLPRVLRAPGGINFKSEPHIPTTLHLTGAQTPYTLKQLAEVLDEWEIPDADVIDLGTKVAELATWNGGDITSGHDCTWFAARVDELRRATPASRHPWALGAAIELMACVRYGCVPMAEGVAAVNAVGARLAELVASGTNPRQLAKGEVSSILQYAIRFVEALTDEQVLEQARYHVHELPADDSPFGLAADSDTSEDAAPAKPKADLDEFTYAARLDPTGDAGLAHAAYEGLKGRYLLTPEGNPLRWDGNYWAEDRLGQFNADFQTVITRYIRDLYSRRQINPEAAAKMTKAAASGNGQKLLRQWNKLVVDPLQLNANKLALATPGGIVELENGRLRPADPETDLNTQITRFAPEIGTPERWLAFLRQVIVDEARIEYLQRVLGSALVGGQRWPDLPIFVGRGANGKSVILGLLGLILSGYAVALPEGFLVSRSQKEHPTELADLRGKRLATLSEVDPHGKFNESRLKALTGGDPIRARRMRQDFEEFWPDHTFLLALNHLLQVASGGDSLFRRIRIITFDVQIPLEQQNPDLAKELAEQEGGHILTWLIEGARKALNGGLAAPKRVMDDTLRYRYEEDHVANFAAEMLTITPGGQVLREDLMRAYSRWCRLNVQEALPGPQFFRELPAKIDLDTSDPTAPRHYVYGIRLTSDLEAEKTGFVQPGTDGDWAARAAGEG